MMTASEMSAAIRAKKKKALMPDDGAGEESLTAQAQEPAESSEPADMPAMPSPDDESEKKRARIRASLMKARK